MQEESEATYTEVTETSQSMGALALMGVIMSSDSSLLFVGSDGNNVQAASLNLNTLNEIGMALVGFTGLVGELKSAEDFGDETLIPEHILEALRDADAALVRLRELLAERGVTE